MIGILSLPDEILDKILSYVTYDEVSHLRLVCKRFDCACQRVLNQGFHKVEKFHAQCLRKVKEQLPRRESERRKHPLSTHCDILTAIETRLSLLGMTFMKFVDLKYCCFIPGKVLDEIYKILRYVSTVHVPPRAHEILQELRDISSMAMEHFDEKIAPAFRNHGNASPKLSVTPYGAFSGSTQTDSVSSSSSSIRTVGFGHELVKLVYTSKQLHSKCTELKKENIENRRKLIEYRRKLAEQDKKIIEQNSVIVEQGTRIAEQEGKISELSRKFIEYDKCIGDIINVLNDVKQQQQNSSSSSHSTLLDDFLVDKSLLLQNKPAISEVKFNPSSSTSNESMCSSKKRSCVTSESKRKRQKMVSSSLKKC